MSGGIRTRGRRPNDRSAVTAGEFAAALAVSRETMTTLTLTPNEAAKHGITVRLDGVRRTAQGVAVSAGIPDNLAPIVTVLDAESAPVTYNDPKLTARVKSAAAS